MKFQRLSLFFIVILFTNSLSAQTNSFVWANQIGGVDGERNSGMAIDNQNNIITIGRFNGTADLDPGIGALNFTANGSTDEYIQKLDSNGTLVWVKQLGNGYIDFTSGVTVDDSGNIYVVGTFSRTMDFDPNSGVVNLTSFGGTSSYVLKLDPLGNFVWVRQLHSMNSSSGRSISIQMGNRIIVSGNFEGTADFDHGLGSYLLTSNGDFDCYLQALDLNGDFLWAKQIGGIGFESPKSVKTDVRGNVYFTGTFQDSVDFDPGTGTFYLEDNGGGDIFFLKLDSIGNFIWSKSVGGPIWDDARGISVGNDGSVYCIGSFFGMVDFDPDTGVYILNSPNSSSFILKLDSTGSFMLASQISGVSMSDLTLDAVDDLYITGYFGDSVDFDPGPGVYRVYANNSGITSIDAFTLKLSPSGSLIWVEKVGGTDFDFGSSVAVDLSNKVLTAGSFQKVADFNPRSGVYNLVSTGTQRRADVFIQKLNQNILTSIDEPTASDEIKYYPNPAKDKFSVQFSSVQKEVFVRISAISGQFLSNREFQNSNQIEININQPRGAYLVDILHDDGVKNVILIVE